MSETPEPDHVVVDPKSQLLYNEDGVDLTLLRHTLSLTPYQRLLAMQQFVNAIERLRRGCIIPN